MLNSSKTRQVLVELDENGRPKITPDVLDDIRDMLEDKWECEVVILHWQWFD